MEILNGEFTMDNGMIVTIVVLVCSLIAVRAFAKKILEQKKKDKLLLELKLKWEQEEQERLWGLSVETKGAENKKDD